MKYECLLHDDVVRKLSARAIIKKVILGERVYLKYENACYYSWDFEEKPIRISEWFGKYENISST